MWLSEEKNKSTNNKSDDYRDKYISLFSIAYLVKSGLNIRIFHIIFNGVFRYNNINAL